MRVPYLSQCRRDTYVCNNTICLVHKTRFYNGLGFIVGFSYNCTIKDGFSAHNMNKHFKIDHTITLYTNEVRSSD
jgi:hypothetical protein